MLKKLLLLLFVTAPVIANVARVEFDMVNPECVSYKGYDKKFVFYYDKKFYVGNGTENTVKPVNMALSDKMIRRFEKNEEVELFFKHGGKFDIKQYESGEYSLACHMPLKGGGIGGAAAGFWTGKFLVHFVAQVGIGVATAGVAIVCPPAAVPFYYAAQATMALPVEAASNVVALGVGIIGAAATGPV